MTPSERLKDIESDYAYSEEDIRWLIARVKKLTEVVEYYQKKLEPIGLGDKARKILDNE